MGQTIEQSIKELEREIKKNKKANLIKKAKYQEGMLKVLKKLKKSGIEKKVILKKT